VPTTYGFFQIGELGDFLGFESEPFAGQIFPQAYDDKEAPDDDPKLYGDAHKDQKSKHWGQAVEGFSDPNQQTFLGLDDREAASVRIVLFADGGKPFGQRCAFLVAGAQVAR
jgi:hypothetical protein